MVTERDREMAQECMDIALCKVDGIAAEAEAIDDIAALLAAEREEREAGLVGAAEQMDKAVTVFNGTRPDVNFGAYLRALGEVLAAQTELRAALVGRLSPLTEQNRKLREALKLARTEAEFALKAVRAGDPVKEVDLRLRDHIETLRAALREAGEEEVTP